MIEYIIFFGLLAAGLLAYLFRPKIEPVMDQITAQRIKCESPIERRLYDTLVFNGYVVSTQVQCGKYRIDIAITSELIAIECDGKDFHSLPSQKAHDRRKNKYLRENGWTVLRFSGKQICNNIPKVISKIDAAIKERYLDK
jgi:very-short-patch-repair endonuclease